MVTERKQALLHLAYGAKHLGLRKGRKERLERHAVEVLSDAFLHGPEHKRAVACDAMESEVSLQKLLIVASDLMGLFYPVEDVLSLFNRSLVMTVQV